MKFSLVLCLLPAVILAQDKISREEETCREQEGASDEDVEMLQSFMTPETRTTKCYYSCVMQKIGYSDGQRFDKEGFLSTAVNFSSKDRETMQRIADRCEGELRACCRYCGVHHPEQTELTRGGQFLIL